MTKTKNKTLTSPAGIELPKAPRGKQWVYRGTGWTSPGCRCSYLYCSKNARNGKFEVFRSNGYPGGVSTSHYFEAVKIETHAAIKPKEVKTKVATAPAGVNPGNPPKGMQWVYRGTGWNPGTFCHYCYLDNSVSKPAIFDGAVPSGSKGYYFEAIALPASATIEPVVAMKSCPLPPKNLRDLSKLPKPPRGKEWVYRGKNWSAPNTCTYCYCYYDTDYYLEYRQYISKGKPTKDQSFRYYHYFEAVPKIKAPAEVPVTVIKATPVKSLTTPLKVGQVAYTKNGEKSRIICTDRLMQDGSRTSIALRTTQGGVGLYENMDMIYPDGRSEQKIGTLVYDNDPKPFDWKAFWSIIPPWYTHAAMDMLGSWYVYTTAPSPGNSTWADTVSTYPMAIPKAYAPPEAPLWKDSLQARP